MGRIASLALALAALCVLPQAVSSQILLEWELGMTWVGRNDIRVPAGAGTEFSTVDDLTSEPGFAQRMRFGYLVAGRHAVTFLFVPFEIQAEGEFDGPVGFEGVTFPAAEFTLGRYQVNEGRLSYRYGLVGSPRFRLRVGGSATLRRTKVSLENEFQGASKSSMDFMPLVAGDARLFVTESVSGLVDVEGLVWVNGMTFDAFVGLDVEPAERFRFRVGYRMIQRKLDQDDIYNRLLSHHGVIGISLII